MFGKEKISALETQLLSAKNKLESATKEKADLEKKLDSANDRIKDLEKQVAESELEDLKKQARQTIVEYEGLKSLYVQKVQELEDSRASVEEGFVREAAIKRDGLSEEIKAVRDDHRAMVKDTTATFAGSYLYYLDQIRLMMDALNQAAKETGETLFDGNVENIREAFGARILEHLRYSPATLRQNEGDRLLIDAEEIPVEVPVVENSEDAAEVPVVENSEDAAEAALKASQVMLETVTQVARETSSEAEDKQE